MSSKGDRKSMHIFKVVILGESGVGKTSLAARLTGKKTPLAHSPTVGLDFIQSTTKVDDVVVRANVWDTAGQEKFHSMLPAYCRSAQGAIFMFDLTDIQSFASLNRCLRQASVTLPEGACKMLLGNKRDLAEEGHRDVPSEMAIAWAKRVGARYIEVSALYDDDIKETFHDLAHDMLTRNPKPEITASATNLTQQQTWQNSKCC